MKIETLPGKPQVRHWSSAKKWLENCLAKNKNINETDLLATMLAQFKQENLIEEGKWETIFDEIFTGWFNRSVHAAVAAKSYHQEKKNGLSASSMIVEKIQQQVDKVIKERAQIELLKMLMPNGKKLSDCTGADCTKLGNTVGPWLLKLGRRLRPRQHVGTVFSETELAEIYHMSGSINAKRKIRK